MRSITVRTLYRRLSSCKDSQFVGITALLTPEMRKKDNPFFGDVCKVSMINGAINFEFQTIVNKQRQREGARPTFCKKHRQWGHKLKDCPLVKHAGKAGTNHYLDIKVQSRADTYFRISTGERIVGAEQQHLLSFCRAREQHAAARARQGLIRHIVLRDLRLDHIAELRIEGNVWTVRPCCDELHKLTNRNQT